MPDEPLTEHKLRRRLAKNVRYSRLDRHWTQEQLAEAAGLARTYISEVERSDRNITLDVLERLGNAFGVDGVELLQPPQPQPQPKQD